MTRVAWLMAVMMLAGAAGTAGAGQVPESKLVRAEGCVQPGVEISCLMVKDILSGKLYNILIKGQKPKIGDGIEFTGVPFRGVTVCMQGSPVEVTKWERKDSLKCTKGKAQAK